jgi:hypothetical protein
MPSPRIPHLLSVPHGVPLLRRRYGPCAAGVGHALGLVGLAGWARVAVFAGVAAVVVVGVAVHETPADGEGTLVSTRATRSALFSFGIAVR